MASKLNEDIMRTNLDLPEGEIKLDGALDPVYADAIEVHEKKKEQIKDAFKEQNKTVDKFIKDSEKKMELSESLFEDYNEAPSTYDKIFNVLDNLEHLVGSTMNWSDEEWTIDNCKQTLEMLEGEVKSFRGFVYDLEHPEAAAKYGSVNEQLEADDEDGWGDEIESTLEDFLDKTERIAYEVRHCRRGTYGVRGDSVGDLVSALEDISEDLSYAIDKLSNQEDELNEATAVLDRPVNKSKKFGGKKFSTDYIYKAKRDPLADIIQDELTSGETVYRMGDDGKIRPTWAPSLNLNYEDTGASSDENGDYIIANVADDAMVKQVEAIGHKYGKEVKTGYDKYISGTPYWVKIYISDEDWDQPYFDPNVKTIKDVKR